jgi:hypothetical protein
VIIIVAAVVEPVRVAVVVALVVAVVVPGLVAAFVAVFVVDVTDVLVAARDALVGAADSAALLLAELVAMVVAVPFAALAIVFVVVYFTVSIAVRTILVKAKWYSSLGWSVVRTDWHATVGSHQTGITGQSKSTGFDAACVSGPRAVVTVRAMPAPMSRNSRRKSILHSYGCGDFFGR